MIADELVTILGVELKGNALNNIRSMEAGISKLASVAKAASVVVAGLAAGATLMVNSVTAQAAELQKTADKTGVTVEQLQELDYIAAKTGTDAKALRNDVIALTKSMSSPIPGQFNMNLMMLGVSANKAGGGLKTSAELLGDIAGKLQGMSQQRQLQWAARVGISDETLLALKSGKEEIKALAEEAHKLGFIIPAESIKRAADFRKELGTMRLYLDRLKQSVVIGILPIFERLLSWFKELVDFQSGAVMRSLEDFAQGVVMAWDTFMKVLAPFGDIWDKLTTTISDFLGVADKAEMWAHLMLSGFEALLIFFAPFIAKWLAIAAAVKVVLMVIEDLFAYFTGSQESLTGTLLDTLAEKFPRLTAMLKDLKDWITDVFSWWYDNILKVAASSAWAVITATISGIIDFISDLSEAIGKWIDSFGEKYPNIVKYFESIKTLVGIIKDAFKDAFSAIGGFITKYATAPINAVISVLKTLVGWLGTAVDLILKGVDTAAGLVNKGVEGLQGAGKSVGEFLSSGADTVKGWFNSDTPETVKSFTGGGITPGMGMALQPAYIGAPRVSGGDTNTNIYITTNDAEAAGRAAGTVANNPNLIHTAMTPGNVSPVMR